jgi:hypothetical protein
LVGAIDKEPFRKVIDNFESGDYLAAVDGALDFAKNDSSVFKNDSKFFLKTFFSCMLREDRELARFEESVSQCGDADKNGLGYYSDYQTMLMIFDYFATKKIESTGHDFWDNIPSSEKEFCFYSDDEEFPEEDDESDSGARSEPLIRGGTRLDLSEIIELARKFPVQTKS